MFVFPVLVGPSGLSHGYCPAMCRSSSKRQVASWTHIMTEIRAEITQYY